MGSILLINPEPLEMAKRRHRSKSKSRRRARRSAAPAFAAATPRKRRRRSRRRSFSIRARRNPIINTGGMLADLKPAAVGVAGALANDVLVGYASKWLPPSLQVGPVKALTKGAIAVLAGQLAGRFVGKDTARKGTIGALICVGYGAARDQLKVMLPNVPLGALGDQFDSMPDPYMGQLQYDGAPAIASSDDGLPDNAMGELQFDPAGTDDDGDVGY